MEPWQLAYHPKVVTEDIPRLGTKEARRIARAIEQKLTADPMRFGKPLRHSRFGVRTLRVGDWRVLFVVKKQVVYIGAVKHRSVAYESGFENRFV